MKENGVLPDNFSYRICINSYGTRSDLDGMEKVLEEMELQHQTVVDWSTYTVVASIHIKAGLTDKAIKAHKKAEEKLDKRNGLYYSHLIALYGHLGNKLEMQRLWELQKVNYKKFINRDYTTMLGALVKLRELEEGALVKLRELEEAEVLLKEWESSGNAFDFWVPNVLIIFGYRQKGLLGKSEAMLNDFLRNGKKPPSNGWGIVAAGYEEMAKIEKAYEFILNAFCVYAPNVGWEPNSKLVKSILHYLGDEGDVEGVETSVGFLKNAIPTNRDMYHTLIKANARAGREVDEVLKSLKADGTEENEDMQQIMSSKSRNTTSSSCP